MKFHTLLVLVYLSTNILHSQTIKEINTISTTNPKIDSTKTTPNITTESNTTHQKDETEDKVDISFGGYLETFYSHNFNKPANNINALRGFDFIANSLTVSNFVLGTDAKFKNFSTRLAINIGMTPSQFYKQEPITPCK